MDVKMLLCALPIVAGCNVANDTGDDRPATFEFVTEAILKPSCGTAECHSAMKRAQGYAFDSLDGARKAFKTETPDLVFTCSQLSPPEAFPCNNDALNKSRLYKVIDDVDSKGNRMPLDQALSNKDIVLIRTWLQDDAPGLE